jgi:hypothetical protein
MTMLMIEVACHFATREFISIVIELLIYIYPLKRQMDYP